jgi:hypothetical protein
MGSITIVFTRRDWNPVSLAIRCALPRALFCLAKSSHCVVLDGDQAIEATMLNGTRRVPIDVALHGARQVLAVTFVVPDAEAGLQFGRDQATKKKPYDFKGAFGLAWNENWQDDDCWYCYELAAAILKHAGLDVFSDYGRQTEMTLLTLNPYTLERLNGKAAQR